MKKSCLLALVFALNFTSVSAVNASIVLFEWGVNIDGAVSFPSLGDPASNLSFYLSSTINISQVPIPAAVWLFGSGLIGLVGIAGKKAA